MFFNLRKILIILIIVFAVIVIVLGSYNLFFAKGDKPSPPPVVTDQFPKPTSTIETNIRDLQDDKKITPLTDEAAIGAIIDTSGQKIIYYSRQNGQVFRISFDGKIWERLSDAQISGLENILWSPAKDKVIVTRKNDQGKIEKYLYDYNKKQASLLDSRIGDIVWSPDGRKILYHFWDQGGGSNLAVANPDGSNWKSLMPSEMRGLIFTWPRQDLIAFVAPEGSFYGKTLYLAKWIGEELWPLEKFLDDQFSLGINWSPSSAQLVYSKKTKKDAQFLEFYIKNLTQGEEIKADFNVSANNCIWAPNEKSLYCAEKTSNFSEVIPDDYEKKLLPQSDGFWKINLETNEIQELYLPKMEEQAIEAENLLVSPLEDYLFFVNRLDGKLYSLRL